MQTAACFLWLQQVLAVMTQRVAKRNLIFGAGLKRCDMLGKEINFDRFVRGLIFVGVLVAAYFLVSYLSPVLVPFFVAWALAYMLFPLVEFFQYKCRLRFRMLSIMVTLACVAGAIGLLLYFFIPAMTRELLHLKDVAVAYVSGGANSGNLPAAIQKFLQENSGKLRIEQLLNEKDLLSGLKETLPKVWTMLQSTANVIISIVSSLIALLYLVFMLNDYDRVKKGWIRFVPKGRRDIARKIVGDVDAGMSGYFRGQALVALANCVLFSAGFIILGIPMPVGLGVFIGIISFIPYVQLLGFIPATILAILCAVDTGRNFWMLMLGVIAVYCVVQVLQDSIITPHIMGKILGLRPAVVLLSLTVWGYLLGIIGLIVALPLTQILVSYYRYYVVDDPLDSETMREEMRKRKMEKKTENP